MLQGGPLVGSGTSNCYLHKVYTVALGIEPDVSLVENVQKLLDQLKIQKTRA